MSVCLSQRLYEPSELNNRSVCALNDKKVKLYFSEIFQMVKKQTEGRRFSCIQLLLNPQQSKHSKIKIITFLYEKECQHKLCGKSRFRKKPIEKSKKTKKFCKHTNSMLTTQSVSSTSN